ncbi:MAG: signal peptidase I [Longimicrobiales bacterium]|nr:signal peptidase I [Longimicrobiales bacterium]
MSRKAGQGRREPAGPDEGGAGSDDGEARGGGGLKENVRSLLAAVAIFLVIRTFLLQTFFITSGSMEDSLLVGDFLVVNRAVIGSTIPFTSWRIPGYGEPRRGDILVFDPPHEPDLKLVKRLVGLPGDTLEMRDRVLYRNGVAQDEPYVKVTGLQDSSDPWMAWQAAYLADGVDRSEYRPTRDDWGPLVLPPDRYFMLGDNRDESLDSRYWGLLEGWRLEGRASFIYYSYNRESYRPLAWLREVRWGRIFDRIR